MSTVERDGADIPFGRVRCRSCGAWSLHPADEDARLAVCGLCGKGQDPTEQCDFARPTPTGAWKRCRLDLDHVGGHVLAPIRPKRGPTERQQDTMNAARSAEIDALDAAKDEDDPQTEHEVLRRIGLRNGPKSLREWEQGL